MQIQLEIPSQCFLKNPGSSDIGKKIISEGLALMNELGLEDFTFKKLAQRIQTTESTIYRYFESKNQLLFYFFNYYWALLDYKLTIHLSNLTNPEEKLKTCIKTIVDHPKNDNHIDNIIDHDLLYDLLTIESSKTFLSKKVDEENKNGYFTQYKQFVNKIAFILLEINPNYPYPHALISTIIESNFHQQFYRSHLPRLTNQFNSNEQLFDFLYQLCYRTSSQYSSL